MPASWSGCSTLIGHSDGSASTDKAHLKVSNHHNFFDGSRQRHPRVRFGEPAHVYNNYFRSNDLYGVASTMDAGVLVEGNYLENVPHPILVGYGDSGPGWVVQRNNIFAGSGAPQTAGTVQEPRSYYSCTLDNATDAAHRPCGRGRRPDLRASVSGPAAPRVTSRRSSCPAPGTA
ncbi:pectate lyase family protein [Lentzea atacamensis]|uniref:pectate lyase family protein n=1 Tax=Lentzea atacamensis TaxID=531938 RepID=UPI001F255EFF|nr:hypothetical protein [Lentzea atacamensis]